MDFLDLNSKFNFFIGLDQTGAVLDGGVRAKPLPIAFVDARGERARLIATSAVHMTEPNAAGPAKPLKLASFSKTEIAKVLGVSNIKHAQELLSSSSTAILADAVFGLPARAWNKTQTLRSLFEKAATDTSERAGYGLKPAAHYFNEILSLAPDGKLTRRQPSNHLVSYPVRDCEKIANANSVFRTHPFQKNIQCGTYRFWRDLGLYGSDWIHLRYFERAKDFHETRPILFEAYPSLIWREALKLRTRDRTKIREALKLFGDVEISAEDVDLMERDADHADACILALGGYWLAKNEMLVDGGASRNLQLHHEGWIAGLARETR